MTLRSLERLAAAVAALFLIAMCALVLDHARRSEQSAKRLLEGHVEAVSILSDTEFAIEQGRQLYAYLIADGAVTLDDPLGIIDTLAARLAALYTGDAAFAAGAMSANLGHLRAGLLFIDEMRARDEFSDTMSAMVEEVYRRLASASQVLKELSAHDALPAQDLSFLANAMDSLRSMTTRYLQAKPDRLPVFNELMAKVSRDLNRLMAMPEMQDESQALKTLSSEVSALRANVPRLRANILYDPNFMASTSKAEKDEVKRLWDAAMRSVRLIKERQAGSLPSRSDSFQQELRGARTLFLALSAAALVLAAAGLYAIRRTTAKRLAQLKEGAALISGGSLDHRIHPVRDDSLGELAAGFNSMAESLQREKLASSRAMEALDLSRDQQDTRFRERHRELGEAIDHHDVKDFALAHSHQGVMVCDENLRIIDANPALSRLTGYEMPGMLGLTPDAFCANACAAQFSAALDRELGTRGRFGKQIDIVTRDGKILPVRVHFSRIHAGTLREVRHVGIWLDISEQENTRMRLVRQSRSDTLTGLPTREALLADLDARLEAARADGREVALALLDLDGFKAVNDRLGHAAGDALLKIVSLRLEAIMRKDGMVARLGEDEFALASGMMAFPGMARALAVRAMKCFEEPFEFFGESQVLSACVGLAVFSGNGPDTGPSAGTSHGPDALALVRDAGLALHRAKSRGKGRIEAFTPELDAQIRARTDLETDLRDAAARKTFEVHYQPILESSSGRVAGAEALLRWRRGDEPVSPGMFIPLCEEMGIMREVTDILLDRVTRDILAWEEHGIFPRVNLNVSAQHFSDPDFPGRLEATLKERGVAPERIGIEITETSIMKNPKLAGEILSLLRHRGHAVSVDGFGTGGCSLRCLQRFPCTTLKIARQFIHDLDHKESRAIVLTTIALAKSLELTVVAEGVESAAQMELLKSKGSDFVQGFYFSPALPPARFAAFCAGLAERQGRKPSAPALGPDPDPAGPALQ